MPNACVMSGNITVKNFLLFRVDLISEMILCVAKFNLVVGDNVFFKYKW